MGFRGLVLFDILASSGWYECSVIQALMFKSEGQSMDEGKGIAAKTRILGGGIENKGPSGSSSLKNFVIGKL